MTYIEGYGRVPLPHTMFSRGARSPDVVTTNLLLEYRFDDGSGTTLTDYISGNNGTLGTSSSDRPDWVTEGLDFVPGNSDVVTNATLADTNLLGALTVIVVANIDTGSAFREFVCKAAGNGGTQNPLDFRTDSGATPKLVVVRANTTSGLYNGPNVTVGGWKMYSVVCPSAIETSPTFYVNTASTGGGIEVGAATGAPTGSSANLRVGRRADGATQMDGKIAYLSIYNAALSSGDISTNYTALQAYLAGRGISL